MATAYAVQQNGTVGTTPIELRRMLSYKWLNKGIVGGFTISTKNNLNYGYSNGLAICSKGASDGFTEAWAPGGNIATTANSSANPRLDAIWVEAHDVTQGDADNLVRVGITNGTAAATPTVPAIPAGATLIAVMQMPAGATTTKNATLYQAGDPAIPFGASLGVLMDKTWTNSEILDGAVKTIASGTINVPTARAIDIKTTITVGCEDRLPVAYNRDAYSDGNVSVKVLIDGVQIAGNEVRAFGSPALACSQYFETSTEVEAGRHTIKVTMQKSVGTNVRTYWSARDWAGQRVQVVDVGPVA